MEQLTETKPQQLPVIPEGMVRDGIWYVNPMPQEPKTNEERYDHTYPLSS